MFLVPIGVKVLVTWLPLCAVRVPFSRVIVVGRFFLPLPEAEQDAIIAHEYGHIRLHSLARRTFDTWALGLRGMLHQHEFEADAFAARLGYAEPLAAYLSRSRDDPLHPPIAERVSRLRSA